jgi:spore coat protein JB
LDINENQTACNQVTTGILPECGMLAVPYVPVQRNTDGSYQADKGLARGTLFPGLDLPYRGMVNEPGKSPTPLQELMALGFAVYELGLYLDTHKDDQEAQELFMKYNKLYGEGEAEYERRYGPLQLTSAGSDGFDWVSDPWPWDLPQARDNQLMNTKQEE